MVSEELQKFTTSTLRGFKTGARKQSIAFQLAKSARTNDPLIKIPCICEAASAYKDRKKLDMNLINACAIVSQSFQNTQPQKSEHTGVDYINIAWAFPKTEENWKHFIKPWQKTERLHFYTLLTELRQQKYPRSRKLVDVSPFRQTDHYNEIVDYNKRLAKQISSEIRELPPDMSFFETTTALDPQSYSVLVGEFTVWALIELSETKNILLDCLDPEIFNAFFGVEQKPKEKEKHSDNGNTMGTG